MSFKVAIPLSAVLHLAFVGYLYTLDLPAEQVQVDQDVIERFASADVKMVRADEMSADGGDDPARGVPNPVAEAEPETEPKPQPEPASEPEREPDVEPKPEPEPEPEPDVEPKPEPKPDEELKSVVTDKTDDSESPVETDSDADSDARAVASTAPVDSGEGKGSASSSDATGGTSTGEGSGAQASGPRGIRRGTGEEQKKLNQKYGLILYREINKAKTYPRFARKAQIEGKLLVAITVDRTGKILEVEVRESSGHKILDRNTLDTIRDLKRFPLPPDGLAWQTKTFVLPVSYKLT